MKYNFDSEEFKSSSIYKTFIDNNSGKGILKIEASTASEAYPLKNVSITISKRIGDDEVIFYEGVTNDSGIIDGIILPTKEINKEVTDVSDIVFTTYDLVANYPKYNLVKNYDITIFDNVKVIQPITFAVTELIEGEEVEQQG